MYAGLIVCTQYLSPPTPSRAPSLPLSTPHPPQPLLTQIFHLHPLDVQLRTLDDSHTVRLQSVSHIQTHDLLLLDTPSHHRLPHTEGPPLLPARAPAPIPYSDGAVVHHPVPGKDEHERAERFLVVPARVFGQEVGVHMQPLAVSVFWPMGAVGFGPADRVSATCNPQPACIGEICTTSTSSSCPCYHLQTMQFPDHLQGRLHLRLVQARFWILLRGRGREGKGMRQQRGERCFSDRMRACLKVRWAVLVMLQSTEMWMSDTRQYMDERCDVEEMSYCE